MIWSAVFTIRAQDATVISSLQNDVKFLASDKMEGRMTGTKGEKKAASYIAKRMKKLGLLPAGTEGYYQPFNFESGNGHVGGSGNKKVYNGKNVLGKIDNGASRTVIIGAHYDHLGYGETGSRHTGEKAIHNGADDNASGVAVLLHLADLLRNADKSHNYLLIAFSAEELGLGGSKRFVENPTVPLRSTSYMINMDMVGRLMADRESRSTYGKLAINGVGTSPKFDSLLNTLNRNRFDLILGQSGIGPSDHTSFYLKEIPVLHFFSGQHSDYHKPTDDFEKLNYHGMYHIATYINELVKALNTLAPLPYQRTKSDSSAKAPKLKVTLGIMPDYMFSGEGLKIDGVIPERPAARAGIAAGDVIISIGEKRVKNIQDYMQVLGAFNPGEKAILQLLRKDEEIELEVIF
jgi:Zn-dependent M28 family amino/carboxypeptidase